MRKIMCILNIKAYKNEKENRWDLTSLNKHQSTINENLFCFCTALTGSGSPMDVNRDAPPLSCCPASNHKYQLLSQKPNTNTCTNHLAVCGCVLCACSWWSRGRGGHSPGRGELPPLSTLGALLLGETLLLLQLLLEEQEEALETRKPGERHPCRTRGGDTI